MLLCEALSNIRGGDKLMMALPTGLLTYINLSARSGPALGKDHI